MSHSLIISREGLILTLRKQDDFCWKLYEHRRTFIEFMKAPPKLYKSRMTFLKGLGTQDYFHWIHESSTKGGWLKLKALQKQDDFHWKQDDLIWKLHESSTKAGWLLLKALQTQDDFHESRIRMTFVESSTKAECLSFNTLWKPFKKHVKRENTKFCDKMAYVGGPSFRRRPWPFGQCCYRDTLTPAWAPTYAMLLWIKILSRFTRILKC